MAAGRCRAEWAKRELTLLRADVERQCADGLHKFSINSSRVNPAWRRRACRVLGRISLWFGTVTWKPALLMRMWEPSCRVTVKPSRRNALTVSGPETSRGSFPHSPQPDP